MIHQQLTLFEQITLDITPGLICLRIKRANYFDLGHHYYSLFVYHSGLRRVQRFYNSNPFINQAQAVTITFK